MTVVEKLTWNEFVGVEKIFLENEKSAEYS